MTRILEPYTGLPEPGSRAHWTSDYANPPIDYKIARLSSAYLYALIESHVPGGKPGEIYSFWVPIGTLLHVRYDRAQTIAERYAPQKQVPAVMDPEGLDQCKTPYDFMEIAERIGMDDDSQVDLLTVTKRAPNNGQVVMQGRNAIRRWLRARLKDKS